MIISLLLGQDLLIKLVIHDKHVIPDKAKLVTQFLNALDSVDTLLVDLSAGIGVLGEHGGPLTRLE
jgi:hypothetical protein